MVQTWMRTPSSAASFMSSSRDLAPCFFITCLIMTGPMPSICILERGSLPAPRGSITPNILSMKPFLADFLGSRSAAVAQKVKNMSTSMS